jgi:riboflavin kinase/FMN adenylyltransferase
MTFAPHPQEFFSGQSLPLLTPLAEKAVQISHLGIEQLVLLPFNRALADLSPVRFVEDLLVKQLRVQRISVGQDFCFGKNRQGTATDLKALAEAVGVRVEIVPLSYRGGDRISSSRIRTALRQGDLRTATDLLGRAYSLCGRVVPGQRLGRQLGFPTANLDLPADKFLPAFGVYSVWVEGLSGVRASPLAGVMNLGNRPTVGGSSPRAEVHLLDWPGGDLYGHTLQVSLQSYLRPEQTFSCLENLRRQIQVDCQLAQADLARATVAPGG